MPELISQDEEATLASRLAELERRIGRVESRLETMATAAEPPPASAPVAQELAPAWEPITTRNAEELELVVGQTWFAKGGVVILTVGVGFMLSLPYSGLPTALPGAAGLALVVLMLVLAHVLERTSEMMSGYLRAAALALGYFAIFRLYFFGPRPVLTTDSGLGRAVLALTISVGLAFAVQRKSPVLTTLALLAGFSGALVVGAAGFVLPILIALTIVVIAISRLRNWPWLPLAACPMVHGSYLLWSLGNPFRTGAIHVVTTPTLAPACVLLGVLGLGVAGLLRADNGEEEDPIANSLALVNCGFGYGVFLLHTFAAFQPGFGAAHGAAFVLFLGLAILFWIRAHTRVATFLYAMTGYAALTATILKLAPMPDVFVWLSIQSVVVATTAIWFRSRFIIVANFAIYVAIVLAYMILAKTETGISVGFGLVALLSARILNWQKGRLELKTELMRNAYLLSGFIVFPYALYHLVPLKYVALAWVGIALGYYTLNLIVRNQKYRWMGHATLLLTTVYLVVIGISRFEPVYRVISFLVLGTVLLVVSLAFTRQRRRQLVDSGTPVPR